MDLSLRVNRRQPLQMLPENPKSLDINLPSLTIRLLKTFPLIEFALALNEPR